MDFDDDIEEAMEQQHLKFLAGMCYGCICLYKDIYGYRIVYIHINSIDDDIEEAMEQQHLKFLAGTCYRHLYNSIYVEYIWL